MTKISDSNSPWVCHDCHSRLRQWQSSAVSEVGYSVSSTTGNGHNGFTTAMWRKHLQASHGLSVSAGMKMPIRFRFRPVK